MEGDDLTWRRATSKFCDSSGLERARTSRRAWEREVAVSRRQRCGTRTTQDYRSGLRSLSLAVGRRRISEAVQLGCARSRVLALPPDAVPERSPRTRDQPTGDGNSSHSHGSSWDRFQTELLPAAPVPPAKRVLKWPPGVALMEALPGSLIVFNKGKKKKNETARCDW